MYKGSVQALITHRFGANPEKESLAGCWQVDENQQYCPGSATFQEIVTGLPILLVLEIEPSDIHDEAILWDFPVILGLPADRLGTLLATSSPSKSSQMPFTYSLVGGIFLDDSDVGHFIVRESRDGNRVQEYNDLQQGIIEQLPARDKPATAIGGSNHRNGSNLQERLHLVTAYYTLNGGADSQTKFSEMRHRTLEQKFDITLSQRTTHVPSLVTFTKPNIRKLSPNERLWLSPQKRRSCNTFDFVQLVLPMQTCLPNRTDMDLEEVLKPKLQQQKTRSRRIRSSSESESLEDFGPDSEARRKVKSMKKHTEDSPSKAQKHQNSNLTGNATPSPPSPSLSRMKRGITSPKTDSGKYRILCRCGVDEERDSEEECEQDIIACTECGNWSHHACHLLGWTYDLKAEDVYSCFDCDPFQKLQIRTKVPEALQK